MVFEYNMGAFALFQRQKHAKTQTVLVKQFTGLQIAPTAKKREKKQQQTNR